MGQLDIFNVIRHTIRLIQMGQLDNGIIGQLQHDTSHNQRDTSWIDGLVDGWLGG